MKPKRQRKPTRLKGFDYAQSGGYFVTICTHEREHLFGSVTDGMMLLNQWGQIAADVWEQTANLRPNISIDAFVIMPNHIHVIIFIEDRRGLARQAPTPPTFAKPVPNALGTIVGAYKASVTRLINTTREDRIPIWQRNYHDHIIRSEADLNRIREYIMTNPARWTDDVFYAA